jgi:oxygen-dependent protoporphyrinogen oxidase
MQQQSEHHVVIIGGGISGLTAAHELYKNYSSAGLPVKISLMEKSAQLGGSIQTLKRDGFIIEKGPDSFLSRKPAVLKLSKELGLDTQWTGLNPAAAGSFIYLNGRLHPMPEGLAMGIPTRIKPFAGTDLLTIAGKVRAAFDLLLPRKAGIGDESLGSLIKRRLGHEVADNLVGPILAGIYAGDLHLLSANATFPRLLEMEATHRSLILGMLTSRKKRPQAAPAHQRSEGIVLPPHLRNSMFLTFKGGLNSLVERLIEVLLQQGIRIYLNSAVTSITQQRGKYQIRLSDQSEIIADGIIMAAPAEQAMQIIQGSSKQLTSSLKQIPSASVANVVMAFDFDKFPKPLQGSGFVMPRQQGFKITACTWTSMKWAHTAPKGKILIRAYVGHWGDQSHRQLDDHELVREVKKEMEVILGNTVTPIFTEVSRHHEAMSQYFTGHLERLQAIEEELHIQWPRLILTGRSYRGVGIPDCIAHGEDAAQRLFMQMFLV